MTESLIFGIFLVATFVHGLTGFGFGLVSVPLLQSVIGVRSSPPLVTLISALVLVLLAFRYRYSIQLGSVLRLALASTLVVPLGVYGSQHLNEHLITGSVGLLLISYGIYALLNLHLPHLLSPQWAYLFGCCSGLLAGLSNLGGPPLILYGSMQRWPAETFKSNLQGVFLLNLGVILISHSLQGNFTPEIWKWFRIGVPGALVGLGAGIWISGRLDPASFRTLVLVALIGLGIHLVIRTIGAGL